MVVVPSTNSADNFSLGLLDVSLMWKLKPVVSVLAYGELVVELSMLVSSVGVASVEFNAGTAGVSSRGCSVVVKDGVENPSTGVNVYIYV